MTNEEPKVADAGRYTMTETCKVLGIHRNTLRRWLQAGKIKVKFRRIDNRKVFEGREIKKSLEDCPMMNAYEKAKQLTAKWEQERKDSKRLETMKEAERRIQVREFDNMLCLSLDGVPVLPMSEFNKQTLADARLTFFNYLIRR